MLVPEVALATVTREPVLQVTDVRGPVCALTEAWACPRTGGVRKCASLRRAQTVHRLGNLPLVWDTNLEF